MEKIDLYQSTILLGILEFLDFLGVRGYFYLRNSRFILGILDFRNSKILEFLAKISTFILGILEFPRFQLTLIFIVL